MISVNLTEMQDNIGRMYNLVLQVFGADLVLCLYSRGWKARVAAVKKLRNYIVASHYFDEEKQQQVLRCCIVILTMVVADPVFEVYLGCIVSFGSRYFHKNGVK
jgi:hypothetical protein